MRVEVKDIKDGASLIQFLEQAETHSIKQFLGKFYQRLYAINTNDQSNPQHRLSHDTNAVERLARRLDSMARLVVGDEVCAAVCLVRKDSGFELWFSTNQQHEDPKLYDRVRSLFQHVGVLAKLLHESRATVLVSHELLNAMRKRVLLLCLKPYILYRQPKNSVPSSNDQTSLDTFLEHVVESINAFYTNTGSDDAYDVVEAWIKTHFETLAASHLSDHFKSQTGTLKQILSRYLQDLLKLEQFFSSKAECSELAKVFSERRFNFKIIDTGNADTHAEMRLLTELAEQGDKTDYIGLSKLPCAYCHMALTTLEKEPLFIQDSDAPITRGFHGNPYPWRIPHLLLSERWQRAWLGDELFEILRALDGESVTTRINDDQTETLRLSLVALHCLQYLPMLNQKHLKHLGITLKLERNAREAADPSTLVSCAQVNPSARALRLAYFWFNERRTSSQPPPAHKGSKLGYITPYTTLLLRRAKTTDDIKEKQNQPSREETPRPKSR